jgi:predicted O-methyltransferase YrrM
VIALRHLSRIERLVSSTLEHGPTPVRIALVAKRRGAKQKLRELAALVALVRRHPPATVVEIGTLHGGTLWTWCQAAADDAIIVSIDLPGGPFGGGYSDDATVRLRAYARADQTVHLIRADSHDTETLERLEAILGRGQIDLLFIDGDHTWDGVRRDFEMYSPLVRPGGLIALHDILPHEDDPSCEVDRFWQEIAPRYRHVELVDREERGLRGQWGGIGVLVQHDA